MNRLVKRPKRKYHHFLTLLPFPSLTHSSRPTLLPCRLLLIQVTLVALWLVAIRRAVLQWLISLVGYSSSNVV